MIKTAIVKVLEKKGYTLTNNNKPQTSYVLDRKVFDLYEKAQEKCQMTSTDNTLRRQRHYTLNHLLWNTASVAGDVCECGVWRGLSAYQIATFVQKKKTPTAFHIFDSFEGLSEYKDSDLTNIQYDVDQRRKQFACSQEAVQKNLSEFSFIKYYKGWIPDRFPEVKDKQFSFVHIDVDLYQPIADAFRFFYPRLAPNGIMVFDDYGYVGFPGAQKAVDECLNEIERPFFVPLPSGQAFLVKK